MNSGTRPITQKMLADKLGLSRQAVSFALGGGGTLSEETRERIKSEAARLGYRPNVAAKAMASGRFGAVALLSGDFHRGYLPSAALTGIEEALAERGARLVFASVGRDQLKQQRRFQLLDELSVDGVLLMEGAGETDALDKLMSRQPVPCVWLNRQAAWDCVFPAERTLARLAAAHLVSLGHTNMAWLDHTVDGARAHFSREERRAGFREEMKARRLPARIIEPEAGASLREVLGAALRAPGRPTALACAATSEAELALLVAAELGIKVPAQLSIITIAVPRPSVADQALCYVRQPFYWVGRRAVEMLWKKLEQPGKRCRALAVEPVDPVEGATAVAWA
jgi:DNA-binding LacI/PurR family transcriptional regulator